MFRFKQFSVPNTNAAFKVGTDAVLLGAAVSLTGSEGRILDAGTGSGIIALMVAQRLFDSGVRDFLVDGVDVSAPAAALAADAFAASPWSANLRAHHLPLADAAGLLADTAGLPAADAAKFDLIVSNPPYFENSLPAPDPARCAARHVTEEGLNWKTLLEFAALNLAPQGRLAMILPAPAAEQAMQWAEKASAQIKTSRKILIKTGAAKPPTRIILEFQRLPEAKGNEVPVTMEDSLRPVVEELVIQENGRYTQAYKALTKPFHPEELL